MRIRKRAVPLPLSLLSPVPFSDPHLHLVQLSTSQQSNPPDLRRLIPHDRPTAAASTPQPPPLKACEDEKMSKEQKEDTNNTSKQSDSGAIADDGVRMVSLPLSPSNQALVEGRWCDGDKAIPLKKRKASFEMNGMVVAGGESKMKSKTNKKCPHEEGPDDDDDDDDDYEEDDNSDSDNDSNKRKRKRKGKKSGIGAKMKTKKKKKKKGGSLMEGSRCSRVNGRGWRCMQPTLVGYSLCEHHLGKGRLRSMASVRARSNKITSTTLLSLQLHDHHDQQKSCTIAETPNKREESMIRDYDNDEEERPISAGNGRKRTRIGMVKARSLSSLLCLPDVSATSVAQIGATPASQAT